MSFINTRWSENSLCETRLISHCVNSHNGLYKWPLNVREIDRRWFTLSHIHNYPELPLFKRYRNTKRVWVTSLLPFQHLRKAWHSSIRATQTKTQQSSNQAPILQLHQFKNSPHSKMPLSSKLGYTGTSFRSSETSRSSKTHSHI